MVAICACESYKDADNNEIVGNIRNCKVIFKGKNSRLEIGANFRAYGQDITIILEDDCEVIIDEYFQVGRQSVLFFRTGAKCKFGRHTSLGNQINIYCRGSIQIGDYFCMREFSELRVHGVLSLDDWVYFQHHVTVYVPKGTEFHAGKDTGLSWYAKIIAGSGHSTFDLRHKIKIEDIICDNNSVKKIILGNHVWVGCGSTINNEVIIGDGSVVASNSIIWSGNFESNCIISGNPAKKVSENVSWDRRPDLSYEEYEKYIGQGYQEIKRPSFFDEYYDQGITDDYYM